MSPTSSQPYPRPDFLRPQLNWTSLNGQWDFYFDDANVGLTEKWYQSGVLSDRCAHQKHHINVPFVFQTPESGLGDLTAHEVLWYTRDFSDIRSRDETVKGTRLLVHFGAVDYETTVWVNDHYVGYHRGGHTSFSLDVTDSIMASEDNNRLTVRVRDSPYDLTQPRGKQYWKPQSEEIFYTPSSGIWQNVWLESTPMTRIADSSAGTILRSNDIDSGMLHTEVRVIGRHVQESLAVQITVSIGEVSVSQAKHDLSKETDSVSIDLPMWINQHQLEEISTSFPPPSDSAAWKTTSDGHLALWSPEHPLLYNVKINLLDSSGQVLDEVLTEVGMRSLSWNHTDNTFRLNDRPYFQALVLDQGYWPRTNITPPNSDALKLDIELSKAMGFNGCRKHQKVEDSIFLYWADHLGYLVWGEMGNAYEFSSTYVDRFDAEWKEAVMRDINHPCIVAWTPINESWGYDDLMGNKRQRDHIRSLYYMTKTLDPTRPVNDNCGWEHVCTDLTTFHDYADADELRKTCASMDGILKDKSNRRIFTPPIKDDAGCTHSPTAPVICTEFGGVNIAAAEGDKPNDRDWGYTTASDPDDLVKRIEALIMGVVEGGICCGFVYTQLTDVEQEVNGLYSFDRKPKLDVEKVKAIIDKSKARYFELLEQRTRGTG